MWQGRRPLRWHMRELCFKPEEYIRQGDQGQPYVSCVAV